MVVVIIFYNDLFENYILFEIKNNFILLKMLNMHIQLIIGYQNFIFTLSVRLNNNPLNHVTK